jgi:predicted Na+-dependent transporter
MMNSVERFKLEKKIVPLVDKYSIFLFIAGIASVALFKSNKISVILCFSYFLTKALVYIYTTQFSVAGKLKEKERLAKLEKSKEDELEKIKELDKDL